MKRCFPLALVLVLFSTSSGLAENYDFRKTRWGMSKAQVKAAETTKPSYEKADVVSYQIKLAGKQVLLSYLLHKNQLYKTGYVLNEKHTNENSYIDDYKQFKDALTKKYGQALKDDVFWYNDLYKSDYSQWGFAVSIGHMAMNAKWETETTSIVVRLTGDNYEITCMILYFSKELGQVVKKAQEQKKLDDF